MTKILLWKLQIFTYKADVVGTSTPNHTCIKAKIKTLISRKEKTVERKNKIMEFELFASKEEKDARQRNIEQKIGNDKKRKERQKISRLLIPKILSIQEKIEIYKKAFDSKSLSIEFSLFETSKDEFLVAFLKTIDYEKFKELIILSCFLHFSLILITSPTLIMTEGILLMQLLTKTHL